MPLNPDNLAKELATLETALERMGVGLAPQMQEIISRWRADAAALRFHLQRGDDVPPVIAILGGTGVGKSTVVNRLLNASLSATSFRRTFTAGAVVIAHRDTRIPVSYLNITHTIARPIDLPVRGKPEELVVIASDIELLKDFSLMDTPDLDGDELTHHVQAQRVFKWADAVLFLVTPEKYQMTELLGFYRLAGRYGIPALFAMNKCEEEAVLADYAHQLGSGFDKAAMEISGIELIRQRIFAIPRDDSPWTPPTGQDLIGLRKALAELQQTNSDHLKGLNNRNTDLAGRLNDQVITPLNEARKEADRILAALEQMETPEPGLDVNPITHQLQRKLQQRSVLYLMGPQRVLERVRQVPALLVRLPRSIWDTVIGGKKVSIPNPVAPAVDSENKPPDFRTNLVEQFTIIQSRIDDIIRGAPLGEKWFTQQRESIAKVKINPSQAGDIVDEELGKLKTWLEQKWHATPRDTGLLMKLLKHLPGGEKLVQWAEATPYLLAIIMATQHALFHGVDLVIYGGFHLTTWLTEKLSNEVTTKVRDTNTAISERFTQLAHQQIKAASDWADHQSPTASSIKQLVNSVEAMSHK